MAGLVLQLCHLGGFPGKFPTPHDCNNDLTDPQINSDDGIYILESAKSISQNTLSVFAFANPSRFVGAPVPVGGEDEHVAINPLLLQSGVQRRGESMGMLLMQITGGKPVGYKREMEEEGSLVQGGLERRRGKRRHHESLVLVISYRVTSLPVLVEHNKYRMTLTLLDTASQIWRSLYRAHSQAESPVWKCHQYLGWIVFSQSNRQQLAYQELRAGERRKARSNTLVNEGLPWRFNARIRQQQSLELGGSKRPAMFGFLKTFKKAMSCAARFDEGVTSGYQQLLPHDSTTEDRQIQPESTPDDVEFVTGLDDLNLSKHGYSPMMVRGMGWAGRQGVGITWMDRKRRMWVWKRRG
ncbi:hypothetical protein BXZ70DRAFT_910334 [Cristinia sonorae]|uniref:Uncharacterized protein n=1 Tax=Cristinia sonorae TaxID=1940300 RepID=A0A8K0XL55_9AGAR|nr:hypothetical protein BXZ70DRAFT_910334 [Cristinia sonorae]